MGWQQLDIGINPEDVQEAVSSLSARKGKTIFGFTVIVNDALPTGAVIMEHDGKIYALNTSFPPPPRYRNVCPKCKRTGGICFCRA